MSDIKFIKSLNGLYPFRQNMADFEKEYEFTFNDGRKGTPKYCKYNGNSHVYLDNTIMDKLTHNRCRKNDTTMLIERNNLIRYIKKNFDKGRDELDDLDRLY